MTQAGSHPLSTLADRIQPRDRTLLDKSFRWFCIATASTSIMILAVLLVAVFYLGIDSLNWNFMTHYPEPNAAEAGLGPALWGTIWVCIVCGVFALPIGVATAVFLEEFKPSNKWLLKFHGFIQLNINNLAGVPSVVYGILGLTLFVSMAGLFGTPNEPFVSVGVRYYDQFFTAGQKSLRIPIDDPSQPNTIAEPGMRALNSDNEWVDVNVVESRRDLPRSLEERRYAIVKGKSSGRIEDGSFYYFRIPFGRSVLAGSLTLMLVILPIVIISTQEALRGVPQSLREAGLGLGSTKWQVVRNITLPAAIPGIMTGSILSMSRAIGEAAPILILAGAIFLTNNPGSLMDDFTVLPLQIFDWAGRPHKEFHHLAGGGILVLLAILFVFNLTAVLIRQFTQKNLT